MDFDEVALDVHDVDRISDVGTVFAYGIDEPLGGNGLPRRCPYVSVSASSTVCTLCWSISRAIGSSCSLDMSFSFRRFMRSGRAPIGPLRHPPAVVGALFLPVEGHRLHGVLQRMSVRERDQFAEFRDPCPRCST